MSKYIKNILFITLVFSFGGCFGRNIASQYEKLNNKFIKLTNDKIVEKNRADLEKEFTNFVIELKKDKSEDKEEIKKINEYIQKSNIKIEYLKDLKD